MSIGRLYLKDLQALTARCPVASEFDSIEFLRKMKSGSLPTRRKSPDGFLAITILLCSFLVRFFLSTLFAKNTKILELPNFHNLGNQTMPPRWCRARLLPPCKTLSRHNFWNPNYLVVSSPSPSVSPSGFSTPAIRSKNAKIQKWQNLKHKLKKIAGHPHPQLALPPLLQPFRHRKIFCTTFTFNTTNNNVFSSAGVDMSLILGS